MNKFEAFNIRSIPRSLNSEANMLANATLIFVQVMIFLMTIFLLN